MIRKKQVAKVLLNFNNSCVTLHNLSNGFYNMTLDKVDLEGMCLNHENSTEYYRPDFLIGLNRLTKEIS